MKFMKKIIVILFGVIAMVNIGNVLSMADNRDVVDPLIAQVVDQEITEVLNKVLISLNTDIEDVQKQESPSWFVKQKQWVMENKLKTAGLLGMAALTSFGG